MNDMHVDRNGTEVISKKTIFDEKLCLSNICRSDPIQASSSYL